MVQWSAERATMMKTSLDDGKGIHLSEWFKCTQETIMR